MAKNNSPIFDVAQPGQSVPSDNSKSVIISNRPLLKDPMMAITAPDTLVADTAANGNTDKPAIAEASNKSEPALTDPVLEAEGATKPEEPTTLPEEPATAEELETKTSADDELTDEAKASKAEAVEQAKTAEDDAAAKRQTAITKLAESKQYYLPINTVEKRRSRRFVGLGILLSLLLIVAWADIALDAGLIHLGSLKAPTHFFSN
jgi:hypothetical protein